MSHSPQLIVRCRKSATADCAVLVTWKLAAVLDAICRALRCHIP